MPDMNCCDCCSCCDCDCEEMEKESKGEVCCCCWPISSGVTWIGIFASAWFAYVFIDNFCLLWNDYVDGYFILINFLILIPAVVGLVMYWIYAAGPKRDHKMVGVYMLSIFLFVILIQVGW